MSISRNTTKQKMLVNADRNIFTNSDLAVLWGITNKDTLLKTINRYVKRNVLVRLARGVYSKVDIFDLDPFEIGCAVSGQSSYVSAETILQKEGVIMQYIDKVTLFGRKKKEFTINGVNYLCRYLNIKYLLNREGIKTKDNYYEATSNRAIVDILHINPSYYFDNKAKINKMEIAKLRNLIGYNDSSK